MLVHMHLLLLVLLLSYCIPYRYHQDPQLGAWGKLDASCLVSQSFHLNFSHSEDKIRSCARSNQVGRQQPTLKLGVGAKERISEGADGTKQTWQSHKRSYLTVEFNWVCLGGATQLCETITRQ